MQGFWSGIAVDKDSRLRFGELELRMDGLMERLRTEAARLGFSLCGVAPATAADSFDRFAAWLDAGYAGEMNYLAARREARRHPASILPDVRSVVMLGYEYGRGMAEAVTAIPANYPMPANHDLPANHGRVARYAQGPDYHQLLWHALGELAAWLERERPDCRCRGVTDTAPLLERDFARRAGLGWIGKNTMLIHPRRGSYFFLAALLVSIDLPADKPFQTDHCGTCTACLDACPTQAFPMPGTLDATQCISYLTIEHRGPVAEPLREPISDWLFGCDVCQEVCPWNRFEQASLFPHDEQLASLDCIELLGLDEAAFRQKFRGTSLMRAKYRGLRRNAALVLGNGGDERAIPALQRAAADADPLVADAARWALERLRQRHAAASTSVKST